MSEIVEIVIGDLTNDGHYQSEKFLFESNVRLEYLQELYRRAAKKHPEIAPHVIFSKYEENTLLEEYIEEIKEKFDIEFESPEYDIKVLANYVVAFICSEDKLQVSLKPIIGKLLNAKLILDDPEHRNFAFFGYGLFV